MRRRSHLVVVMLLLLSALLPLLDLRVSLKSAVQSDLSHSPEAIKFNAIGNAVQRELVKAQNRWVVQGQGWIDGKTVSVDSKAASLISSILPPFRGWFSDRSEFYSQKEIRQSCPCEIAMRARLRKFYHHDDISAEVFDVVSRGFQHTGTRHKSRRR